MNKYRVEFKSGFSIFVTATSKWEAEFKALNLTGLCSKDVLYVLYDAGV